MLFPGYGHKIAVGIVFLWDSIILPSLVLLSNCQKGRLGRVKRSNGQASVDKVAIR